MFVTSFIVAALAGIGITSPLEKKRAEPVDLITEAPRPIVTVPHQPYPTCFPGAVLCIDGFTCGQAWGG